MNCNFIIQGNIMKLDEIRLFVKDMAKRFKKVVIKGVTPILEPTTEL